MKVEVAEIKVSATLVETCNALLAENEQLKKELLSYTAAHCPICHGEPELYYCDICEIMFYRNGTYV